MFLKIDKLQGDLLLDVLVFLPELLLCVGIVVLLLWRLVPMFDRTHLGGIALAFTLAALAVSICQWKGGFGEWLPNLLETPSLMAMKARPFFTGLLVYDHFTIFLRCFLFAF